MNPSVGVVDRTGRVAVAAEYALEQLGVAATLVEFDAPFGPDARRVDVLVVGPQDLSAAALRRISRWRAAYPGSIVVAVLPPGRRDAKALRGYGVSIAVSGDLARGCVTRGLRKAFEELDRLRRDLTVDAQSSLPAPLAVVPVPAPRVSAETAPAPIPAPVPAPESEPESDAAPAVGGTLVTIASAAGGCGKTFFATNAATVLSRAGHRVLLVDLDLQFGEVAAALRIRHPYSLYDGLYDASGRHLDRAALAEHLGQLVHHHPLGFDVLTAPRDPAQADYVGARDANAILDVVLPRYDVVVVDTPPTLNEVVLTALERSTAVAVLATLDVPSLKNMRVFLDTLRRLRIDDSGMQLVLNKVEDDIGVDVAGAQEAFAGRFVGEIPLSRSVSRSINAGNVLVEFEPRSDCSRKLAAAIGAVLAGRVALDVPAVIPEQVSWRTRIFNWRKPVHVGGSS